MSDFSHSLSVSVYEHFAQLGHTCADLDDLRWVVTRGSLEHHPTRTLTAAEIEVIEKQIRIIPTGKQRDYRQALNNLLFYLQTVCQWTLPEARQLGIRDTDYQWFVTIAGEAHHAQQVFTCYQQQKTHYLTTRGELSATFIALMLGFEVAPLSLFHLAQLLNDRGAILTDNTEPRLRVHHRSSTESSPVYTHYYLPLMSFRLLSDYYAQSHDSITESALHKQLAQWLQSQALPPAERFTWSRRFQIHWYNHHHLPPIFLKDLAIPERHVSLPSDVTASTLKDNDIYAIDWDMDWFTHLPESKRKTRWPHSDLLKAYSRSHALSRELAPVRDVNNLLPRLLYDYTWQLITKGGVKKRHLAVNSITKYTGLTKTLEPYPLSYSDAINEEAVNAWAQSVYDSLTDETNQHIFIYFLRFLSAQEQTDGLDLSRFSPPISAPSVSPARLTLTQFDTLIHTLIATNTTHPFRSLFAVIASLLGFFAMLRRGEVLRLRCQDMQFVPKTGLLNLTITHTQEGRTKNGETRTVATTIPKRYRRLFQALLIIKESAPASSPLLGFEGEKYHSRQLYYFVPITRALKRHFGSHMKFHHLRHSGVHLLMTQTLHFVSGTPERYRGETMLEHEVLSKESVSTRFEDWLEGRHFSEVNDGFVLDKVLAQIGHTHYATTRWSYLHDIDWLLPIISPAHQPYSLRDYTHTDLRYLMGLSATSNDLSRRLNELCPEYARKTLGEKRSQAIRLTDAQLRGALFGHPKPFKEEPEPDHFRAWQQTIHASAETLVGFLFKTMMINQCLDLSALSHIWGQGCQHDIEPISKASRTAFRQLPAPVLSADGQALTLTMACNQKNARAFATAFRQKTWRWLECRFELSVNRKLHRERQVALLNTHYVRSDERVCVTTHALGPTSLTIVLTPKRSLPNPVLEFTQQFIQSMSQQKVTP